MPLNFRMPGPNRRYLFMLLYVLSTASHLEGSILLLMDGFFPHLSIRQMTKSLTNWPQNRVFLIHEDWEHLEVPSFQYKPLTLLPGVQLLPNLLGRRQPWQPLMAYYPFPVNRNVFLCFSLGCNIYLFIYSGFILLPTSMKFSDKGLY